MSPGSSSSVGPSAISIRAFPSSTMKISRAGSVHTTRSSVSAKRVRPARTSPTSKSRCSSAPVPISRSGRQSSVETLDTNTPGWTSVATPLGGPAVTLKPGCVRQKADLLGVARAWEQDQLVEARALERRHVSLHRVWVLGCAARDHPGHLLAQPGVVVAQVPLGVLLRVVSEREVPEGHLPRLAITPVLVPRLADLLEGFAELIRGAAGADPTVAVPGDPLERSVDGPADDEARSVTLGSRADFRPGLSFAIPDVTDLLERRVQPGSPLGK